MLISQLDSIAGIQTLLTDTRSRNADSWQSYYSGDHWQKGNGYIGQKPLRGTPGWMQILYLLEAAYVSENVIAEIIDRHVAGVLGREPAWGLLPQSLPKSIVRRAVDRSLSIAQRIARFFSGEAKESDAAQEADESLTRWWDYSQPKKVLAGALTNCLIEDKCLLRVYIPRGFRTASGVVPYQPDLNTALKVFRVEVVKADKGGEFIDDDLDIPYLVWVKKIDVPDVGGKTKSIYVGEVTWVDPLTNKTKLRSIREEGDSPEKTKRQVDEFTYDLGGRPLMYELKRKSLLTPQIVSNQKALNLALTMMMRNVNLAGNLERTILNAEKPKEKIKIDDPSSPTGFREIERDGEYLTGPGVTQFLSGLLIRDEKGAIIGRANPNISFRDPSSVTTFISTRNQYYESILGQCQQSHMVTTTDARQSGRSKEQNRAEYEGSLKLSKEPTDDCGRWMLETVLRMAAIICREEEKFKDLRAEFNSILTTGPLSPEERQENRDDVIVNLLSRETAMSRDGVEDTDGELARILDELRSLPELTISKNSTTPRSGLPNDPRNPQPGGSGGGTQSTPPPTEPPQLPGGPPNA